MKAKRAKNGKRNSTDFLRMPRVSAFWAHHATAEFPWSIARSGILSSASGEPMPLFRLRRKVTEHVFYRFFQPVCVLLGLHGECVIGDPAPDYALRLRIEQIEDQSSHR